MNPAGSVIVSGSTENTLRLWDPRSCARLMKLRGHTENIKALAVSPDGQHVISGSSDGTIKEWSVGQQRCIQTIHLHTEGVWALLMNDAFTHVISGGRDRKVFVTELRNPGNSVLVCEEAAPVLSLCFNIDQTGIWTTTWNSDVKCWALPGGVIAGRQTSGVVGGEMHSNNTLNSGAAPPTVTIGNGNSIIAKTTGTGHELATIRGGAAIKKYHVLNDKRHIITCDTAANVAIYDVLKVVRSEDLGAVNYDEEIRRRNQRIYIPNWFTVDLKIGMPTIVLGQDEVDCFAAWVSAETGLADHVEPGSDVKINYGNLLLQALLEHWAHPALGPPSSSSSGGGQQLQQQSGDMGDLPLRGNEYFKVPKHTPVIISELAGRTVCRLLVRDTSGENESTFLTDNVPSWVTDVVVERTIPKFIKIPFYLLPHPQMAKQDRMKKDRLVANEFIQCRKVCEHVLEKVLGPDSTPGVGAASSGATSGSSNATAASGGLAATAQANSASTATAGATSSASTASVGGQTGDGGSETGSLVPPEDKIELFCNDVVSAFCVGHARVYFNTSFSHRSSIRTWICARCATSSGNNRPI